jgi:uncharacterized membrane protein YfcA
MIETDFLLLAPLIFCAALLYSSVGHAGASGYLAAMALLSVAPEDMKPIALTLNILVATIATVKFYLAGCFSWRILWPFTLTSLPCAFLGGALTIPGTLYKQIVGSVLLFASYRLLRGAFTEVSVDKFPPLGWSLVCGAGIGLLSGLTGTGGGIFLSPLLLIMAWAETKKSAGVSAAFILVNSVAGMAGYLYKGSPMPIGIWPLAVAAVLGGLVGSEFGSKRIGNTTLRKILAVVLMIAGGKMILGI